MGFNCNKLLFQALKEQMPKEIKDLKEFIKIMRREKKFLPKAEKIVIKKSKKNNSTKFKLRTPKYLYTLMVGDATKADKIMQPIPPNLKKEIVGQKNNA